MKKPIKKDSKKKRVAVYLDYDMFEWLEKKSDGLRSNPSAFLRLMVWDAMQATPHSN